MMLILLFSLVFIMLSSVNTVSADSSIIYVNDSSGNDDWDGQYVEWQTGTLFGPKKSIKNATDTVSDNGTIKIADGNYIGENNTNITINKNMAIIGQSREGTIINGTNSAQIFIIQNGTNVKIQNLTICNGTADDNETYGYGGAIDNNGTCTVENIIFYGNLADFGGAIYNEGNLTINDGIFIENYGYYGGAIANEGNLTIISGNFTGNYAVFYTEDPEVVDYGYGAAIFNNGNLTVISGNFTENIADFGGAITNMGNLTVINGNFTDNYANWAAGAIYTTGGTINMPVIISDSNFTSNTADWGGAAIYNSGTCIITGSNITDNNGIAIYTTNANTQIHFNRILNNTGSDIWGIGSINATNNWWGTNFEGTDPVTAGRVNTNPNISSNIDTSTWLILSLNASPSSILLGSTSTITADLQHDNLGNYYDPAIYGSVPDGIQVNFKTTLGIITDSTTINGIAQSLLNAGLTLGVANVSVTVDGKTVNKLVTVTPPSPPDLRVETVTTNGNTATGIINYPVSSTIKNYGGTITNTFYVSYYLSTDTSKSSNDRYIGHATVNGLNGWTSTNAQFNCTIPKDIAQGNYYIIAVADVTGLVKESNEANNKKASSARIFVWKPDLKVNSVITSGNTATGISNYTVTGLIQNYGSITSDTFYVSYYLSTDTSKSSNDRYIGNATVNGLNGWTSTNAQVNCTIPKDIAQGNYYIIAVVDVTGVVPESIGANNVRSSSTRIYISKT